MTTRKIIVTQTFELDVDESWDETELKQYFKDACGFDHACERWTPEGLDLSEMDSSIEVELK